MRAQRNAASNLIGEAKKSGKKKSANTYAKKCCRFVTFLSFSQLLLNLFLGAYIVSFDVRVI